LEVSSPILPMLPITVIINTNLKRMPYEVSPWETDHQRRQPSPALQAEQVLRKHLVTSHALTRRS